MLEGLPHAPRSPGAEPSGIDLGAGRGLWARVLERRFSTRRRAAWCLASTFVGFHVLAWAFHEGMDPSHVVHGGFFAHLRLLPDELMLQLLFVPIAMHFAVPALFHPGSLFSWQPGFLAGRVFPVLYWSALLGASAALVRGRRLVWWLFIALVLLATVPRFVELIGVALSDV